jgi:hypothetical protein
MVVQGPQLDLQVAGAGRLRPRRREQRPGVGRVVVLLDHAQGAQHVGLVGGAAGGPRGRQRLVAPAAGVVATPGVDQRLRDGGGHPCPQPGGWPGGRELDRLGPGVQRLLDPAGVEQVATEALVRPGRLRRVAGGPGGVPGQARGPLLLPGGAGRRGRPQRQLDPVDAGDRGRLGHPLPQRQCPLQVAEGLGRGQDRLGLGGRPHRRGQRADQVMTGQTVVGQLGRGAAGLGGQQAGVGGVQPHPLAREQVAVDRLLEQRMAERVAPGGGVAGQHPGADRLVQALLQVGLGPPGHAGEQPVGHPAAGHRRHPQHLLGRLGQPLDPGQQHLGQGRRQLDMRVAGPGGQQLLGVERVALRAGVDGLHLVRR